MPTSDEAASTEIALHLAEYSQIKSEQRERIQHRDGLVYTTITAMAAVVAATVQQHNAAVLLLLPPVVIVLAWKYLANDEKIGGARRYVGEQMAPRLALLAGATTTVFGWEDAHQNGVYRHVRRYVQLAVDLLTFCFLPACALAGFWILGPRPAGLVIVSVFEAVLLTGMAWLTTVACIGVPFRWFVRTSSGG